MKNYEIKDKYRRNFKNGNFDFEVKIAGGAILESDKKYFEKLKEKIQEKNLRAK